MLRNGGAYKREETVAVSHFDFDVGDMKCDKNSLLKELCKKYNMTSDRYNSQEEMHNSGETKSSGAYQDTLRERKKMRMRSAVMGAVGRDRVRTNDVRTYIPGKTNGEIDQNSRG